VRDQRLVDARLQRRAVLHQMQPEPCPLTLGADRWTGQPDLRDQITPRELGQHPRVDPVSLARERRQPLHPLRISNPHIPAKQLELVMHKPSTRHRLDRCQHRPTMPPRVLDKIAQSMPLRRDDTSSSLDSVVVQPRPLQTLATEIQTDLQHAKGLPSRRLQPTHAVCRRQRPAFTALKRYLARNLGRVNPHGGSS
jgi:hypothetical protein